MSVLLDEYYVYVYITTADSACQYKVVAWLKPKFQTPADADAYYFRPVLLVDDGPQKKLSEMSQECLWIGSTERLHYASS